MSTPWRGGGHRPWRQVPLPCLSLLGLALAAQLLWHARLGPPQARAAALPAPPPPALLQAASFGEPAVMSRLLSLWLQAFDNQPGVSIPFVELDYTRVIGWLRAALQLDPRNDYPMLAAAQLYAAVPDAVRVRQMVDFIREQFARAPQARWRWMARGVLLAKHRLRDLALALELAEALARAPGGEAIPGWARQMRIFVLEDLGELDAAAALLGALLESGEVRSAQELRFLQGRLDRLRARSVED